MQIKRGQGGTGQNLQFGTSSADRPDLAQGLAPARRKGADLRASCDQKRVLRNQKTRPQESRHAGSGNRRRFQIIGVSVAEAEKHGRRLVGLVTDGRYSAKSWMYRRQKMDVSQHKRPLKSAQNEAHAYGFPQLCGCIAAWTRGTDGQSKFRGKNTRSNAHVGFCDQNLALPATRGQATTAACVPQWCQIGALECHLRTASAP